MARYDTRVDPIALRTCVSGTTAQLQSFFLAWKTEGKDALLSEWVGPKETGECASQSFGDANSEQEIIAGVFYYDESRIQGVKLFLENKETIDIGMSKDPSGKSYSVKSK